MFPYSGLLGLVSAYLLIAHRFLCTVSSNFGDAGPGLSRHTSRAASSSTTDWSLETSSAGSATLATGAPSCSWCCDMLAHLINNNQLTDRIQAEKTRDIQRAQISKPRRRVGTKKERKNFFDLVHDSQDKTRTNCTRSDHTASKL
jgi:hypothetical protein